MAQTLRYSAADTAPDPTAYTPGGRWERIMAALRHRPASLPELLPRAASGAHSRHAERRKVWRAVQSLRQLGFVRHTRNGMIALTDLGRRAHEDTPND